MARLVHNRVYFLQSLLFSALYMYFSNWVQSVVFTTYQLHFNASMLSEHFFFFELLPILHIKTNNMLHIKTNNMFYLSNTNATKNGGELRCST